MRTDGPVVVAVDGSPHSGRTVTAGVDAARRRGARLLLVHRYRDPGRTAAWSWHAAVPDVSDLEREVVATVRELRDQVREHHPDLEVDARVVHGATVAPLLALTDDARLLVVGARTDDDRHGLGVVSRQLVGVARCPVLVARTAEPGPGLPVVVGVDGSAASLAAAHVAACEAVSRGSRLRVVHAAPPRPPGPSTDGHRTVDDPGCHESAATAAVWELAHELFAVHPTLRMHLVTCDGDPLRALLGESRLAALLVVGSRAAGPLRGTLPGSVGRGVAGGASCSVLVVRGRPAERERRGGR